MQVARALGAVLVREPPLDWWCCWRGVWTPVEIKTAKGKYTDGQILFLALCNERQAPVWTWRDESDVYRALGAQRTA